jgi:hypothetical protein
MPFDEPYADLGPDFVKRFGPLLQAATVNAKPKEPALLPAAGAASQLTCEGFAGGKEVQLVLVRAKLGADGKPLAVRETLTYRRDIAGSDLVYDLTGEFMQGKARPFDCDLREQPARLYALMPFQVEMRVSAEVESGNFGEADKVKVRVDFLNGLGKPAAGALPCHALLRAPDGKVAWERFLATSSEGSLAQRLDMPRGKWQLVVRSLLTGEESSSELLRPK